MMYRILLADRDEALLAEYREYLLRDGFDVITAIDGLDCVAKLRRCRPEALVLDPGLLWGDGEGVLAMMHEEADVPLVPVMVLADHANSRGQFGVGVFAVRVFHLKPVAPHRLAQSLRGLLHPERSWIEVLGGEEFKRGIASPN